MHMDHRVDIEAPPERVWAVMTDVERWPEWTQSVSKVELVRPGPLATGVEARIAQPRLGTRTWRVTAVEAGRAFTWETSGPGTRMVATHTITPRGDGASSVELAIDSSGWAVSLLGWLMAPTGRRYIEMEAVGLKQRAEAV